MVHHNTLDTKATDIMLLLENYRLQTFEGKWKTLRGFTYCTPAHFAAAGFFYAGSKEMPDNVKCFFCRRELNEWEKDDDPWEEHKKRGQNCLFVQLKLKEKDMIFKDILTLFLEMRKNILMEHFEEKKKILEQKFQDFEEKMFFLLLAQSVGNIAVFFIMKYCFLFKMCYNSYYYDKM